MTPHQKFLAFAKLCGEHYKSLQKETNTLAKTTQAFTLAEKACGYRPHHLNDALQVLAKAAVRKEFHSHLPTKEFAAVGCSGLDENGNRRVSIQKLEGIEWGDAVQDAKLIKAAPLIPELVENLKQTVASLEHWFPRYGDPEGTNSQMMKNARAVLTKFDGLNQE